MKVLQLGLMSLIALLLIVAPAAAQWPDDDAENLIVSSGPGEQTTPLVQPTSDGGCYVVFYNNASGNYDIYLQRLDSDGNQQWDNGLLISDNPMTTFITEWDFAVDQNDNAIICTNDIRNGGDWDIYGYSISTDGTFNWGPDGVTLCDNTTSDVGQQIMVANNGDIVFAWTHEQLDGTQAIALARVTEAGQLVWNDPVLVTTQYGNSIPRLAPTSDNGFILQYIVSQGPDFWSPRHIYINRFDDMGNPLWAPDGIVINDAGGIGIQMRPDIVSDGNDGAISFWYDSSVNNELHAFVQHINNGGLIQWQVNGMRVNTALELQSEPSVAYDEDNGHIYVFYGSTNSGQSQYGLGAQMLNMNGERQWTDAGVTLVPLNDQQIYRLSAALMPDGGAVVTYLEHVQGSIIDSFLKGIRVDASGTQVWDPSPVVMSSFESSKGHHHATANYLGQMISVWVDKRIDTGGDVYLQNVNPDGTLGPYGSPDPAYVELLNPSPTQFQAGGGVLTYDVHIVSNLLNTWPGILYRTFVTLPGGSQFGPLFTAPFDLVSGMDQTVVGLTQNIPAFAPSGTYTFTGRVGYQVGPFIEDSFEFEKLPALPEETDNTYHHAVANWNAGGDFMVSAGSDKAVPNRFELSDAFPNPFNPFTTIQVALPDAAVLDVAVYDLTGRLVTKLASGSYKAGTHSLTFNADGLASGVYFIRASIPGEMQQVRKVMLLQ